MIQECAMALLKNSNERIKYKKELNPKPEATKENIKHFMLQSSSGINHFHEKTNSFK
jgi:hypothetical protein